MGRGKREEETHDFKPHLSTDDLLSMRAALLWLSSVVSSTLSAIRRNNRISEVCS